MKDYIRIELDLPVATVQRLISTGKKIKFKADASIIRDYSKNLRIKPLCDECSRGITMKAYNYSIQA